MSAEEFDLIEWIRRRASSNPAVAVGIGDDAAALETPADALTLVTTDMLIDGVHFSRDRATPRQIGRKAIARALSDIAAMAGDAVAVVAAMAVPKGTSISYLQEIARGMMAAASESGASLVGGDIATGDLPLAITVTCLGVGRRGRITLRSGARPGDVLLVTGELGGSLLGRHLDLRPRLREARWLRDAVGIHGMIDVSDGLAADAAHLATESGVAIEIWEQAVPISRDAVAMAQSSGAPPLDHALYDGEDYELLFTAGAREAEDLLRRTDLPVRVSCIGEVTPGSGLWIRRRGEERRPLEPGGWRHVF